MKSKKIKILIGVFLILGVSIVFNVNSVSASIWDSVWKNTGEQETIEFLQKYQDYLSYGSFPSSIGYWFGWLLNIIISILAFVFILSAMGWGIELFS